VPPRALAVQDVTVAAQDHMQPPMAEPPVRRGGPALRRAQLGIIGAPVPTLLPQDCDDLVFC
jgi:hypothetical protein